MSSVDDSVRRHPTSAPSRPAEVVRAFLLTYTRDRLGRDAPVASRAAAHDALDALEREVR